MLCYLIKNMRTMVGYCCNKDIALHTVTQTRFALYLDTKTKQNYKSLYALTYVNVMTVATMERLYSFW